MQTGLCNLRKKALATAAKRRAHRGHRGNQNLKDDIASCFSLCPLLLRKSFGAQAWSRV